MVGYPCVVLEHRFIVFLIRGLTIRSRHWYGVHLVMLLAALYSSSGFANTFIQQNKTVVMNCADLGFLQGPGYRAIGLYALKDSVLQPIPFQIEKYSPQGFVEAVFDGNDWTKSERVNTQQSSPRLDDQDLLVFKLRDAGDRVGDKDIVAFDLLAEVQLKEGGRERFIYLLKGGEISSRKYIQYVDHAGMIKTPLLRLGFNPKDLLERVDVEPIENPQYLGRSILDAIKIEINTRFMAIPVRLDNRNLSVKVEEAFVGPIRAIFNTQFKLGVLRFPLMAARGQMQIDSFGATFLINIEVPRVYQKLIERFETIIAIDANNLMGSQVTSSAINTQIYRVDGKMSVAEQGLNDELISRDSNWLWLAAPNDLNIIGVLENNMGEGSIAALGHAQFYIYYLDDANIRDKFERYPGAEPTLGYKIIGSPVAEFTQIRYRLYFVDGMKIRNVDDLIVPMQKPPQLQLNFYR